VIGAWGESLFARINIRLAFVGAVGFTLDNGLTTSWRRRLRSSARG